MVTPGCDVDMQELVARDVSDNAIQSYFEAVYTFKHLTIEDELPDMEPIEIIFDKPTPPPPPSEVPEIVVEFNNSTTEVTTTKCSYELGKNGEEDVLKLLQDAAPTFTITHVSKTGHVGDIHADDEVNNIKYVVEVKQKKRITKDDLNKFINDITNITEMCPDKYVYGVFVSLNTTTIPTIGSTACDRKAVYITETMVTKDIFKMIFSMVPEYVNSLNIINNVANNNVSETRTVVEYQVPLRVREMLATLQAYNDDLNVELTRLNAIQNSATVINDEVAQLRIKYLVRRNFVLDLNTEIARSGIEEFTNAAIIGGSGSSALETDVAFLEYMRSQKRSKITKKALKERFPTHITEISSMKLDDLKKYAGK
jgi:hypothetical protein